MDFQNFKLRDGTELRAPMRVPADASKGVGQVGYQVFLQDNVKGILLHMEAINRATKMFFKDCHDVLHPFGGLGMAAQCMDKTANKQFDHSFWERDEECCKALKQLYPESGVFQVKDSFQWLINNGPGFYDQYDIVYLDPTAMTCKKEHLWGIYNTIAQSKVKYIWFVDSAISKIWLHTKTYSEFFGNPVFDIRTYFIEYNQKLREYGLEIADLTREGTVVYGVVQKKGILAELTPEIIDLREVK